MTEGIPRFEREEEVSEAVSMTECLIFLVVVLVVSIIIFFFRFVFVSFCVVVSA